MDNINVNNNNMKHRNVKYSFNEWYTWDEQRKTGYHCDDKNLLKGLDTWSFGTQTKSDMIKRIDDLLDNNKKHQNSQQLTNKAMDDFMARYYL
jgi:hypothetical protein